MRSYGNKNKNSAAQSHLKNEQYMSDFAKAYSEVTGDRAEPLGTIGAKPQLSAPAHSKRSRAYTSPLPACVNDGWLTGPVDELGTHVDLSERPTLCSAANWTAREVVVGSTDHALYIIDVDKAKKKRTLYNKTNGHAEWVTCVCYLGNGSILSGAQDSKLCLWSGNRATDLKGHSAPISQVCCDTGYNVALSASYDKTVRVWSYSGQDKGTLSGHKAPVLELCSNSAGCAISGDRSGTVMLWDLEAGEATWAMKGVHKGHVTALAWADAAGGNDAWQGCFATGGQDGRLRLWDPRSHQNPAKLELHTNDKGHGALTGVVLGGAAASYMAATCGADGTVRILDARGGVGELACITLTDFPYSFTAAGGLLLAGCGDGSLHVIDMATLQSLYALGANEHAVRTIDASKDKLVASGDNGSVLVYDFV